MTRYLLALFYLLLPLCALAQSWPTQPVRVMIGFPPGGTTDVIGRLTANELAEQLGKPFVVENRGGASGTIGAGVVAKSAPDDHSLILVPSTHGTERALYASLPYEESDFVAIGLIASTPYVFVVHPDFPAKNGAEPLGGTPQRAAAFIRDEQEKWGRVIRDVGIKIN
jgi:tripartite-type tricarboxylate transporter receptor subunit TctC